MKASATVRMRDANNNVSTLTLGYMNPDKMPIGKLDAAQSDTNYVELAQSLDSAFAGLVTDLTNNTYVYTSLSVSVDLDEYFE